MKRRKTYRLITRVDPTPPALRQATLEGMMARREAKEARAGKRRQSMLRIAAAAAVLVLVLTATPLGGSMVSAAGDVYDNILRDWRDSVFAVRLRQSDGVGTLEIIESRLANQFLYLTVKETFPASMVTRDEATGVYTRPRFTYAGSVKNSKGQTQVFDDSRVTVLWAISSDHDVYRNGYENRIATERKASANGDDTAFTVNVQYRVYLPEITDLLSEGEKADCSIEAVSSTGSCLSFRFPLRDTDEAIHCRTYTLDRRFTVEGAAVTLQTLSFSPTEADLVLKIDPDASLSPEEKENLAEHMDAAFRVRGESGETALLGGDLLDGHGFVYDFDEDIDADALMQGERRCMAFGGSYYLVLSDFADHADSSYHMEALLRDGFTAELEYLRWRPSDGTYRAGDLIAHYYALDDAVFQARHKGTGGYTLTGKPFRLSGERGDILLTLREIRETGTQTLPDGRYRHTLDVDAVMALEHWDSMAKDGTWEAVTLAAADGREILTARLQIDTCDGGDGTYAPCAVSCEVIDDSEHFTLSPETRTLYVARVTESQSFEPCGWYSARFCEINPDEANAQRFFRFPPA